MRRGCRGSMPVLWPRNIIPYDEAKVKALGRVESVALYNEAIDSALVEADLPPAAQAIARELVDAGLLTREKGKLVPIHRHSRDPETHIAASLDHKRAKLGYAEQLLADMRRAIDERGIRAHCALGMVTLPDTPEAIAQANAILAEAEDQLRALAEENPLDGTGTARVVIFVGSAPS